MEKIRVLLVDDSAVIRKVLGDLISADPDLELVGTAANGKIALEQLDLLKPDVVTLDIEMPEMDGLQTVKEIRKSGSRVPIIMCSSLTAAGASHTLDALAFGASDYVTKPSSHGVNTREVVGEELIRKIKGLAAEAAGSKNAPAALRPVPKLSTALSELSIPGRSSIALGMPDAIAIGVSTGGPNALQEILPKLPAMPRVPIFIVQHMPPLFTKLLADRLHAQCPFPVVEAVDGQEVKPGHVYLAPGGFHMEAKRVIGRTSIILHEGAPENSCRPAVDVLFRSIAAVYGSKVLAIVLTGMGQDGLKGCHKIKDAGGCVIVQDKESSAVWGMPGAVAESGLASAVFPLSRICSELSIAVSPQPQEHLPKEHRV